MAKRLKAATPARSSPVRQAADNPDNPVILGADLYDVVIAAAGAGVTGAINDKLVFPLLSSVAPGGTASDIVSKAIDAFATFGSAYLVGEGVGMLDRRVGNLMEKGGQILAGGKVLSAVVPGYSLTGKLPDLPFLNSLRFGGGGGPAGNGQRGQLVSSGPAQLSAASGVASVAPMPSGVYSARSVTGI